MPFFLHCFSGVCYLFFHGTVCVVVDLRLLLFGIVFVVFVVVLAPLFLFFLTTAGKTRDTFAGGGSGAGVRDRMGVGAGGGSCAVVSLLKNG